MARGLGKGLDSLIPDYYDEDFDSNKTQSLEDLLGDSPDEEIAGESEDVEVEVEKAPVETYDVKKNENVAEVMDIVDKNPRITLWSSRSAAVFRYLRKTEPEFSISREASILIDEAVSKKYPDIWELFDGI